MKKAANSGKGVQIVEKCQYEFQFQNEFMGNLEEEIGELLGISISPEHMVRVDKGQHRFILRKKDNDNFMLFSAYRDNYVYLLIVRCEKKYEESLKKILLKVCDEIEEDYGEDHRREVKDVLCEANNEFVKLEETYKLSELFDI